MTLYDIQLKNHLGAETTLDTYRHHVLLIVNTASRCGYTPQYKELQALHEQYHDKGFTVLAFPCNQFGGQEPGTDEEIQHFCDVNYKVTFPIFSKIEVNGADAHPLYQRLKEQVPSENGETDIQWNFTKFLVDGEGRVVKRYEPSVKPLEISSEIEALL